MKARILLVGAANTITGGGERHVADLVRGLTARGYDIGLCAPAGGATRALADGLDVSYFDVDLNTRGAKGAIARAIEAFDPDIVHAHGSRAGLFTRRADKHGAQRVIVTLHGLAAAHGFGSFAKLALERSVLHNTAYFITVCESDLLKAQKLGILDSYKASVIYNGIELPDEQTVQAYRDQQVLAREIGVDSEVPLLLHIGRLCAQKDQTTLLYAFAWLRAREPDVQLAMIAAGDGRERAKIERLIQTLNLAHAVHFLDPRPDTLPLYASCDVFVLPSRWEGLPYTVTEAMAAGAPVVSTPVDGIGEAIEEGETGFLVPPGKAEQLSDALEEALNLTGAQRKELAQKSRERVRQRFMLDDMIDSTVSVYERVAEGRP